MQKPQTRRINKHLENSEGKRLRGIKSRSTRRVTAGSLSMLLNKYARRRYAKNRLIAVSNLTGDLVKYLICVQKDKIQLELLTLMGSRSANRYGAMREGSEGEGQEESHKTAVGGRRSETGRTTNSGSHDEPDCVKQTDTNMHVHQ